MVWVGRQGRQGLERAGALEAAAAPQVSAVQAAVPCSNTHLWGAVEARLDVSVHAAVHVAAAAKVDDLRARGEGGQAGRGAGVQAGGQAVGWSGSVQCLPASATQPLPCLPGQRTAPTHPPTRRRHQLAAVHASSTYVPAVSSTHLDPHLASLPEQDVLRLQVAVHDAEAAAARRGCRVRCRTG